MRVIISFLSIATVSAAIASMPARALEPDPPALLISPQEAIAISIRKRLANTPRNLDERALEERRGLARFYSREGARPVWVSENGITDQARRALSELRDANDWGLDVKDFDIPSQADLERTSLSVSELIDAELRISLAIVKYARYAGGGRYDPKDLAHDIDRTPELPAPGDVIDTVIAAADPRAALLLYHPQHEQFKRLRLAYLKALEDEKNPAAEKDDRKADSRRRKRRKARSRSVSQRLLYNMDMWRWMPRDLGQMHILANVPEFKFRVIDSGRIIHEERVITGKVENKTPVFSDEMETIVINPNWNVPNSIKVKELLPGLMEGRDVLAKRGLRLQDYSGRDLNPFEIDWFSKDIRNFRVYMPPSRSNALGLVKFMFPNKHAVYMHDTPTKHLFKRSVRTFSHGCVRVRNPLEFAALILGRDKGWDMKRIKAVIASGENTQVRLETKVPVHLTYFTATVDDDGETTFYSDIYGFEKLVKLGMAGKAHLIVKPEKNLDDDLERITGIRRKPNQETSYWFSSQGGNSSGRAERWKRRVWGTD